MKKTNITFLFLAFSLCFSQSSDVKVTNLSPKYEDSVFPMISYSSNKKIEDKINTYLQVNELEFVPEIGKNPFKASLTATNSYSNYVYFYNWNKLESPKNILSLVLEGEASGAYSESFSIGKNFDLRTGNYINAINLFKPESIKKIESLISQRISKRIDDFVKGLKSDKNPSSETQEQISIYENCFKDFTLNNLNYSFGKDKLTFVAGRCSNHASRALDDLGEHVIEFSYQDLNQHWSEYASNLLSGSQIIKPTSIQNKLYKGKIDGKYPITVLMKTLSISQSENSFSAVYWYDKNKKLIEWNGILDGNKISIIENDYYEESTSHWIPRAFIKANLEGNKIIGTWQDYKTKKYLKLELEEY